MVNAAGEPGIPATSASPRLVCMSLSVVNREYLAPQIRSMNNRFHSEAKLPWSYDYPLANHIATNKSSTNREMPLFPRPCFLAFTLSGIFGKFSRQGVKILPIPLAV